MFLLKIRSLLFAFFAFQKLKVEEPSKILNDLDLKEHEIRFTSTVSVPPVTMETLHSKLEKWVSACVHIHNLFVYTIFFPIWFWDTDLEHHFQSWQCRVLFSSYLKTSQYSFSNSMKRIFFCNFCWMEFEFFSFLILYQITSRPFSLVITGRINSHRVSLVEGKNDLLQRIEMVGVGVRSRQRGSTKGIAWFGVDIFEKTFRET